MPRKKKVETPGLFEEEAPAETGPMLPLPEGIHPSWEPVFQTEFAKPYFAKLQAYVDAERAAHNVFPPTEEVYNAFRYTPLDSVKVFLLGQDPYPNKGHGHGLCFSVKPGIGIPSSLRNIYTEMQSDLGIPPAKHGCLASWAKQGVLMLNAVLTVREKEMNSHKGQGWETFIDAIIQAVNAKEDGVVFLLWGVPAGKKAAVVDTSKHIVITGKHPSPMSAATGFFGSKPFSKTNEALIKLGREPIDWKLPETPTLEIEG